MTKNTFIIACKNRNEEAFKFLNWVVKDYNHLCYYYFHTPTHALEFVWKEYLDELTYDNPHCNEIDQCLDDWEEFMKMGIEELFLFKRIDWED